LIELLVDKLEISTFSQAGFELSILINITVHLMWLKTSGLCRLTEFAPFLYEFD